MLPWAQTQNPIFAISRIISNLSHLSFIRNLQPLSFIRILQPLPPLLHKERPQPTPRPPPFLGMGLNRSCSSLLHLGTLDPSKSRGDLLRNIVAIICAGFTRFFPLRHFATLLLPDSLEFLIV